MCSTAAIGPAISAIGNASGIAKANAEKRRQHTHYLKVREQRWMRRRIMFDNRKVEFEENVDLANINAQRAYTEINNQLNNAKSLAILENQEQFFKLIQNEGNIVTSAAERGVTGKSVSKFLNSAMVSYGLNQALRTRGLIMAYNKADLEKENIQNRLKNYVSGAFAKVSQQEFPDIPRPAPVMGSPGMALMLGMGQAVAKGIGGMDPTNRNDSWSSNLNGSNLNGFNFNESVTGLSYNDFSGSMNANPFVQPDTYALSRFNYSASHNIPNFQPYE